ncbi:MAG: CheR family methyltransferase [Novosphingobium sp.]
MSTNDLRRLANEIITRLLLEKTGQTLKSDRLWRVDSVVESVLRKRGISKTTDLITLLTQSDSEAFQQELVEALLNNETYFFRDRLVFDQLAGQVLPQLAVVKEPTRQLSIWSAGCSTGQEPLSLAMMLLDQGPRWRNWRIDIWATDVSDCAIKAARQATFSQFEIQRGLGVGQMLEYFEETERGWRATDKLRRMVRFERRNMLDAPPKGVKFDLILCRNLLLYLHPDARNQVCHNLAGAMAPHSCLLLGGGEALLDQRSLLAPALGDFGMFQLASNVAHAHGARPHIALRRGAGAR